MDQVASLKSSVEKLSRGEYIHKEILFNNARDYDKRGLGSFPELAKDCGSPKKFCTWLELYHAGMVNGDS